jgi:flagellar basal-body rod modification protein FlgD
MAAVSSIASASGIQMDYMKLLITQLQNQNPMEPLNNNEMASQLAQFSQLQQLENMNTNFSKILANNQLGYANSLVGKQISYNSTDSSTNTTQQLWETVNEVYQDVDGQPLLVIGSRDIALDSVAGSLVGSEISYPYTTSSGETKTLDGVIEQVYQKNGQSYVVVNGQSIPLNNIANLFVGKEVGYSVQTETGDIQKKSGIVNQVYTNSGKTYLSVGHSISLDNVLSVKN